jgi:polar amino acid transport system substrate-binding protein
VAVAGSDAQQGVTTLEDIQGLRLGAQVGTTSFSFIEDVIQPTADPSVYNDNTAVKAAIEAGQIDAGVFDLPTAFYIAAVELAGGEIVAQFPTDAGGTPDEFGMLFEKDNPLVDCVNEALAALDASGELAEITEEWMTDFADAPVIEID